MFDNQIGNKNVIHTIHEDEDEVDVTERRIDNEYETNMLDINSERSNSVLDEAEDLDLQSLVEPEQEEDENYQTDFRKAIVEDIN